MSDENPAPAPTPDEDAPVYGPEPYAEAPAAEAPGRTPREVQRRSLEGHVMTIGRSKAADIRLRDGRLSRKHCQIIPVGPDYLISDLDSRNGTVVNGAPVSKHVLRAGDCISLGGFRLDFTGDSLIITEDADAAAAIEAGIALPSVTSAGSVESGPHVIAVSDVAPAVEAPPVEAPPVEAPPEELSLEADAAEPAVEAPSTVEATPAVEAAPAVETTPAEAPAPSEADEAAARLAEYLRNMGAGSALLDKALGHIAPDSAREASDGAVSPERATPDGLVPDRFVLVRAAAAAAAPAAGLLVPPPPGLAAADPLADTQRMRAVQPERQLARLLATARVRGGAAGLALAVHLGLLLALSAIVLVAASLAPRAETTVDIAPAGDTLFEKEWRPPELPPPPSTDDAEKRVAQAVSAAGKIDLGDWHTEAPPEAEHRVADTAAIAHASRFDDVRSRVPVSGDIPALLANRFEPRRSAVLKQERASKKLAPAVEAALAWLVDHQREDGLWSAGAQTCGHPECTDVRGDPAYDVGVTGLALLVIAAQGEGGRTGPYAQTVSRAIAALGDRTHGDGWIGSKRGKGVYNHVLATLGAMEIAAVSGRPSARTLARAGLRALDRARVEGVGWRYRRDRGEADTAVTTWAGLAFALATRLGWNPPAEGLRTAVDWTRRAYDPGTSRVGYLIRGDGGSRFAEAVHEYPRAGAMSGAGASLLLLAGVPAGDPVVTGALTDVVSHAPVLQVRDTYAWQFGAQALYQAGGDGWKNYASALQDTVLAQQVAEGPARGCFPINDPWTTAGGRVYGTAMVTLALQSFYRYARVSELDK